jgi:hypothetical protein
MEVISSVLESAGDYAVVILKYLVRIITIFLCGLGSVYIPTRQLEIKITRKRQHLIALIAMGFASPVITVIYHYDTFAKFLWESVAFWVVCNVVYVVLGQHFYRRMDHFLDNKIGKD